MKPLLDSKNSPVTCDPFTNPCSAGFACQFSTVQKKYFCCTLDVGKILSFKKYFILISFVSSGCPGTNSYPEVDGRIGDIRSCSQSSPVCAVGFSCVSASGKYICCSTSVVGTTTQAVATTTISSIVVSVVTSAATKSGASTPGTFLIFSLVLLINVYLVLPLQTALAAFNR